MSDIEFKGETEKEKQLNKEIFECSLVIAQKFYRPDGSIKAVHCGWISTIQDTYKENNLLNESEVE